jgi:hypothetical protein
MPHIQLAWGTTRQMATYFLHGVVGRNRLMNRVSRLLNAEAKAVRVDNIEDAVIARAGR